MEHEQSDCPHTICFICDTDVVQIMPAPDYRVWWLNDEDQVWSEPLLAWGLTRGGDVVPLQNDVNGSVETLNARGTFPQLVAVQHVSLGTPSGTVVEEAITRCGAWRSEWPR
jgi:hypothetical protein